MDALTKFRDEVLPELSATERSELMAALVEASSDARAASERPARREDGRRRRFIVLCLIAVVVLSTWVVLLGLTLPSAQTIEQWRIAWVGFDIAELLAFAVAGFGAWRRLSIVIPAVVITGTLLLCDAWFDIVLSWSSEDHLESLFSALVEIPLALALWNLGFRLSRRMTAGYRLQHPSITAAVDALDAATRPAQPQATQPG